MQGEAGETVAQLLEVEQNFPLCKRGIKGDFSRDVEPVMN
jgi:hypothetical protein